MPTYVVKVAEYGGIPTAIPIARPTIGLAAEAALEAYMNTRTRRVGHTEHPGFPRVESVMLEEHMMLVGALDGSGEEQDTTALLDSAGV